MRGRRPVWTLLVCLLATAAFFAGALGDALVFDRVAIADGQWWRLLTGSLAHWSAAHFAFDVLALLLAGSLVELRGERHLGLVYLAAALAIGVTVYWGLPQLRFFAGASGLVTAAMTYLCLAGAWERGRQRWFFLGALVLVALKVALEIVQMDSLLTLATQQPFVPVPHSHLAGAAAALAVFLLTRTGPRRPAGRCPHANGAIALSS